MYQPSAAGVASQVIVGVLRDVDCKAAVGARGGARTGKVKVGQRVLMIRICAAGLTGQVEVGVLRDVDCRAAVGGRREEQRGENLSWKSGATSMVCPVGLKERVRNVEREVQRSRKAKCAHSQMMCCGMQRLRGAKLTTPPPHLFTHHPLPLSRPTPTHLVSPHQWSR